MNLVSNTSEFTADVLRVVNKIMEGSVRCQEELTMMGENVLNVVFNVWQDGSAAREFVSPFSALYYYSYRSLLYSTPDATATSIVFILQKITSSRNSLQLLTPSTHPLLTLPPSPLPPSLYSSLILITSHFSGILPGVLSLLYEASRAIEGAKTREKVLATAKEKPASYTSMAFSSFLPHSMQPPSPSLNFRKVS